MGRKILLVTTDQQRYDTLGCNGGTLARTPVVDASRGEWHPLRARHPAVGRVHAVASDDPHRPASDHARRMDERRAASRRRAVGRRRPPRCRLPHGADRQGALRAVPRSVPALHRERARPHGDHASRLGTHRGFEHLEFATHGAMGPLHYALWLQADHPEAVGMFYAAIDPDVAGQRRGRRRHRRTAGARQQRCHASWYHTDWVADRTIAWLDSRRRRRRLVLLDELSRSAPPVGPARNRRWAASTGATCRCPPATRRISGRA